MSGLPAAGETFGRYVLERKLGQGGMGVVHVARDTVLNRLVALKLVAPHLAEDEEFRVRFAREAETQARLDSPHVVRINDYGEHDGILFISTQLVEGGDLASRVSTAGALPPALAVEVTAQVLDGLEEAHQAGVVHRDVKPANVLVAERDSGVRAYLCDFGIATTAGQGLTRTGQVIGSLPWMAPERHYGRDSGAAGDLYSAGCLFWYALTGAAPYVGSDGEVMRGHLDGLVPQLVAQTPFARKANAVLLKALAKEPEGRYASAAAMARDVRELATFAPRQVEAAEAAPTTLRPAVTRPVTGARRTAVGRPWALSLLVVASLLAAVAGGLGVRAFVTDDPELAAGETRIEVGGRTVTMQPTRTISPLPVRKTKAGGAGTGGAVVEGSGKDVLSDIVGDGGAAGGTAARDVTGSTTSGGATDDGAADTTTNYRYRCWDSASHLTNDLSSCGIPTGRVGAAWMQSAYSDGCYVASPGSPLVESYGCPYAGGIFYVARASDASAGASWLRQRMPDDRIDNDWYTGTVRAGTAYQGAAVIRGTRHYRWGAVYAISGGTWLVFVDSTSAAGRNAGRNAMDGRYRHINWVRGTPL